MTRTEVTEYQANLPSLNGEVDPFLAYGQAGGLVQGQYLKFDKGEWLFGMNNYELKLGTKVVVNMDGMRVGWRYWSDGQVTADLTSLLTERQPQPTRASLGETDKATWPLLNGQPRDPWQYTNIVDMVDGSGEKYVYATASRGGLNAMTALCVAYGKERRLRPGQVPIVELGSDSYMHKALGTKVFIPVLTIVGWADEETLEVVEDAPPLPPAEEKAAAAPTTKAADPDEVAASPAARQAEPPFDVKPSPSTAAPLAANAPKAASQPAAKAQERRVPRF